MGAGAWGWRALLSERFGDTGRARSGSVVPVPVTALVGRDRDVAEVASLLSEEDYRLVVLTGPGRVGKTRLALAVLERTRSHWEGGVAFAGLSTVSDPSSVPETIVSALGFVGQGRGQLRLTSELGMQIGSWPAGGLRGERDKMARDWLMVNLLPIDGQFARAGALIDEILPDARRLEQPSRWALMLMVRALSRPYTAGGPARGEFEEALAVVREAGDPILLSYVLSHFGLTSKNEPDCDGSLRDACHLARTIAAPYVWVALLAAAVLFLPLLGRDQGERSLRLSWRQCSPNSLSCRRRSRCA